MVGLVEDELLVLCRRPEEVVHGFDPPVDVEDVVVPAVQHEGRRPDPGQVVELMDLGPRATSHPPCHQNAGTEALLHPRDDRPEPPAPAHAVIGQLSAVDVRAGLQVVDASSEIFDQLDHEVGVGMRPGSSVEGHQGRASALEGPLVDGIEHGPAVPHQEREEHGELVVILQVLARCHPGGSGPGEVDNRLVGRRRVGGKEEVGQDPLAAVGGVEGDPLVDPPSGALLPGFHPGIQLRLVVGELFPVDLEDRIGNRLQRAEIDGHTETLEGERGIGHRLAVGIDSQPEAVPGGTIHGWRLPTSAELVGVVVPGAAPDESSLRRLVPAPLPDVSRHVVGPVGGEPPEAPYRNGPVATEVAEGSQNGEPSQLRPLDHRGEPSPRHIPVGTHRQAFSGVLGIRRRLIPAHSRDRVLALALRISSTQPGGGTGLVRPVNELPHRLLPTELPSVLHERMLPVLPVPVAAGVDELLVLSVGNLVSVDKEIAQCPDRRFRGRHPHHPRRDAPLFVQRPDEIVGGDNVLSASYVPRGRRRQDGLVSLLLDPPAEDPDRHPDLLQRRVPQVGPLPVRVLILLHVDPGAGGLRQDVDLQGDLGKQLRQLGVVPQDGFRLFRQPVGRHQVPPYVVLYDQPLDLRNGLLPGPPNLGPALEEPDGKPRYRENRQRRRDGHHRATQAAQEPSQVEHADRPCDVVPQAVELGEQVGGSLVSIVLVLRQAFQDQPSDIVGNSRIDSPWIGWWCRLVLYGNREGSRAFERRPTRDHLKQERTQRVDVRTRIETGPVDLFRAHVRRRTRRQSRLGQALFKGRRYRQRNPEIGHRRMALAQQDVPGLDIPVNDVLPVCRAECVGDLARQVEGLIDR